MVQRFVAWPVHFCLHIEMAARHTHMPPVENTGLESSGRCMVSLDAANLYLLMSFCHYMLPIFVGPVYYMSGTPVL